jgi:hypothetical protein
MLQALRDGVLPSFQKKISELLFFSHSKNFFLGGGGPIFSHPSNMLFPVCSVFFYKFCYLCIVQSTALCENGGLSLKVHEALNHCQA